MAVSPPGKGQELSREPQRRRTKPLHLTDKRKNGNNVRLWRTESGLRHVFTLRWFQENMSILIQILNKFSIDPDVNVSVIFFSSVAHKNNKS